MFISGCPKYAFKYHKTLKFVTMVPTVTIPMVHVLPMAAVVTTNYHGCSIFISSTNVVLDLQFCAWYAVVTDYSNIKSTVVASKGIMHRSIFFKIHPLILKLHHGGEGGKACQTDTVAIFPIFFCAAQKCRIRFGS
jgi:hypothetical protein